MEPLTDALRRLRRRSGPEASMRPTGGVRVTGERERYLLQDSLRGYPIAVRAIPDASKRRHRGVDALSFHGLATGQ